MIDGRKIWGHLQLEIIAIVRLLSRIFKDRQTTTQIASLNLEIILSNLINSLVYNGTPKKQNEYDKNQQNLQDDNNNQISPF